MITANGRTYQFPSRPVVGVCMDGCSREYFEAARDHMPHLAAILRRGAAGMVSTIIPSFTNPNNMAIVTGVPPVLNGICGNYYYDRATGREVLMNEPEHLRAPTLLSLFSRAGLKVVAITVKDKLRRLLGKNLQSGICFSVEGAREVSAAENGIENVQEVVGRDSPGVYDPEASVFCLEAGLRILECYGADVMYLSTTDYVQHKHAPQDPESLRFMARIDEFLGLLEASGAVVGITADHGMNAKVKLDGSPKVEFLESLLWEKGFSDARVILPITDPYVIHHSSLGSYATVYLEPASVAAAAAVLRRVPGVEEVLTRDEAATRFKLPEEHLGELVVLADRGTVLGRTPEWHDLSAVQTGLRSHGGLHESIVPMIVNRPLSSEYRERLVSGQARNFDLFDFLCNGVAEEKGVKTCENTGGSFLACRM